MKTSSYGNCCGVRYIVDLYDPHQYGYQKIKMSVKDSIQKNLKALAEGCYEAKLYLGFFAGPQIGNNLYKACKQFGFKEVGRFRNTTGTIISVMAWTHPRAVIKPKKKVKVEKAA